MKNSLFICLLLVGLTTASSAEASSVIFEPNVITVQTGTTFTLPVAVDPADFPQYTVRLAITFPPDLLEVTSFAFGENWLAVPQPGYDSINNIRGELIKTGGFPRGFSSPVSFGTITFRAKVGGDGMIIVGTQSFVLDAENRNTLDFRSQVRIVATAGSPGKASSVKPPPDLPQGETNLFDINLIPQVETSGAGLVSKVAPGEFLPLSVKLLNFGNRNKVDVIVSYEITDLSGKVLYSAEETVAVETTATFVKTIQIPFGTTPGRYIAKSAISYQGQVTPATTEFPFTVERKIFGLFQSDFYRYGSLTLLISVLMVLLGHALIKHRRKGRFTPFDYSDKPKEERIYYEIISDTIGQMRQRAGDRALDVATHTEGLVVDEKTGRVLELAGSPAKVVAGLVSGYEKALGKKVSFSFRPEKTDSTPSSNSGQAGSPQASL